MLEKFIEYLKEQVGQPYLWGGQHTKLTPENYKAVISRKETTSENARRVEEYCEKRFVSGESVLYAYDCSGLGCYWLYNLTHLYKCDVNANTMMGRCVDIDTPKPPEKRLVGVPAGRQTRLSYRLYDRRRVFDRGQGPRLRGREDQVARKGLGLLGHTESV